MADPQWLMGALAADDAYRGDWPDEQPVALPDSPWARGVAAASDYAGRETPAVKAPPNMGSVLGMGRVGETAKKAGQGFVKAVDYYAGMPKRVYEGVQPETPGQWSEGDDRRAEQLLGAQYEWAPSTAFGMTFDPFGVKRSVGAGGVTLGSGAGGGSRIIQPQPQGIRAYHSSPHTFDRFDAGRIGTGEGAQVYGHGLYFAESPAVSGQGGEYWKQFETRFRGPEQVGADALNRTGFDRAKAIEYVKNKRQQQSEHTDTWDKTISLLESGKPVGPRTYEVEIAARPEQMLDWDKPLRNQPEALSGIAQRTNEWGNSPVDFMLSQGTKNPKGSDIYHAIKHWEGSPGNASSVLREAGIPGIKYLDQGSRQLQPLSTLEAELARIRNEIAARPDKAAMLRLAERDVAAQVAAAQSKPTSNYVMFPGTEDKIRIMKMYGLAGAVPTMGALAAADQYGERQ